MTKKIRKVTNAALTPRKRTRGRALDEAELRPWREVQNPPPPERPFFWLRSAEGAVTPAKAGDPLPPEADWYHSGGVWVWVVRGEPEEVVPPPPVPPSVPFLLDDEITADPRGVYVLAASKNLTFAWVATEQPLPCPLNHPREPQALFYRVDLTFLSWVRGKAKRGRERGAVLSLDQERAVDRVWSHACAAAGIVNTSEAPAPGAELPKEIPNSCPESVSSGV